MALAMISSFEEKYSYAVPFPIPAADVISTTFIVDISLFSNMKLFTASYIRSTFSDGSNIFFGFICIWAIRDPPQPYFFPC